MIITASHEVHSPNRDLLQLSFFVASVGLGTAHLPVSSVDEAPVGLTETRVIDY